MFSHLGGILGKLRSHGRRQIEHLDALRLQTDLTQQFFNSLHSSFGVEITFQVMTVTGQSPGRHHPVDSPLEGVEHFNDVEPTGARYLDDFEVRRILHPQ
jgi:hypothetical protein